MHLITMRPDQLRDAVKQQLPLLLPVGCYEYHGEHMPLGTDTLIAEGICKRIAEKTEAVVAMPLYFTPTMNWAAGIEDGDVDFSSEALYPFIKEYLSKLIGLGFKKIYAMMGHQGKNGLPAAMIGYAWREINRDMGLAYIAGWGGLNEDKAKIAPDFFNRVHICDYDEFIDYKKIGKNEAMPVGHGGRGETQLIMALYDGLVQMENLRNTQKHLPSWLDDVWLADKNEGVFWVEACAESWAKKIK